MPVPTLPGTHWPAPLSFFIFLDYVGEALADFIIAIVFVAAIVYYFGILCARKCSSQEKRETCWQKKCEWLLTLSLFGSRKLNVLMFPGLFKELKVRDKKGNRRETKSFVLFLDRGVESNGVIICTFYFLALAIFSAALLVVFRYIPVEISKECLERDVRGHNVYCYPIESVLQMKNTSQLPVDCATYNSSELAGQFVCYTFSVFDLGIAIAAAVALTKLATVSITIYVRVIESVHNCTMRLCDDKDAQKKLFWSFHISAFVVLVILVLASYTAVALIITSRLEKGAGNESERVYLAYAILPILLFSSLITLLCTLDAHCRQPEFTSCCEHQSPDSANADTPMVTVHLQNNTADVLTQQLVADCEVQPLAGNVEAQQVAPTMRYSRMKLIDDSEEAPPTGTTL